MDLKIGKGFNATQLQWIAIVCMVIDHTAWVFLPEESPLMLSMHFLGRLTFPIMSYFIAQGYHYSSNVPRYLRRIFLLAIISMVPFYLLFSPIMGFSQNTVFTLAIGLTTLYLGGMIKNRPLRYLMVTGFAIISIFFDGGFSGIFMIYFMGRIKNHPLSIVGGILLMNAIDHLLTFSVQSLAGITFGLSLQDVVFIAGTLATIPLLLYYNGEKGAKSKYAFYAIYPLHLLIIWVVNLFI
ncbi:MAG: TraX family protein [Lachnospiraceae bacterium]